MLGIHNDILSGGIDMLDKVLLVLSYNVLIVIMTGYLLSLDP